MNCLPRVIHYLLESNPNQHRTTDVIANNPCQAILTPFNAGQLLCLPAKLLNLLSPVTRLLGNRSVVLSQVVGHNIIRAPVTRRDPEKLHLVMFGKFSDFNPFPVSEFGLVSLQGIHTLVRRLCIRIIYLTVRFQRTIVMLL